MNIESDRYFRQHIPVVELVDAVVDTGGRVFRDRVLVQVKY
jgi:hypothetical protein